MIDRNQASDGASVRLLSPEEIGAVSGGFAGDLPIRRQGSGIIVVAYDGPVGGPYTPDAIDFSGIHGSGGTVNVSATVNPIPTVSTPPATPTGPLVASDTHTDSSPGITVTASEGDSINSYSIPIAIDASSIPGSGGVANVTATVDSIPTVSTPPAAPTGPLVISDNHDDSSSGITVTASLGDSINSYSIPIAIDASSIPGSGGIANVTATVDPIATVSTPPAAPTGPLVYNDGGSNEVYYSSHGDYMDGCFDNG